MKKKKWSKPKLVIMIRGTVNESVLEMCKAQNTTASIGVNFTYTPAADCFRPGTCADCEAAGSS